MLTTQTALAIVSPCSTCKNQRAVTQDGKPACPRRKWQQRKDFDDNQGQDTGWMDHLVETGTDASDKLANPVYLDEDHSILVWIATVEENKGNYDPKTGAWINPAITDPAFDTDFITCRDLPVTPSATEAAYFQQGAFMEGDQVIAQLIDMQQPGREQEASYEPLRIGGMATKVNLKSFFPRSPVSKDLGVPGT